MRRLREIKSNKSLIISEENEYCDIVEPSTSTAGILNDHSYSLTDRSTEDDNTGMQIDDSVSPSLIIEVEPVTQIADYCDTPNIDTFEDFGGRRIVDINFFLKTILSSGRHYPFDCSIIDMECINEQRHGLKSTFTLKCKICHITKTLSTADPDGPMVELNSAAVLGALSIGIGYTQLNELMASVNVPCITEKAYIKKQNDMHDVVQNSAWKTIQEAGAEEFRLAKELGDVDKNGIPCITVITDGAWCKRSYNVNYNALSGAACIIGQRTGKLLYLGVRNKYCCMCEKYKHLNTIPPHKCFKNWSGTSTSMETDIILEGFKCSIEMHGLKYTQMVGDGDSSVSRAILENKLYGQTLVHKVECRNHLMRNFSRKISEIVVRPRSLSKNAAVSTKLSVINFLRKDLINAPSHVFGEHKDCAALGYFKCTLKGKEENVVQEMQQCGVYQDILAVIHRLIHNSSSLLANMSNNDAEHYNSIICKFVGGKRVNYSLRGGYEMRCSLSEQE